MKKIIIILFASLFFALKGFSQESFPAAVLEWFKSDDSIHLSQWVTKDKINVCYKGGEFQYSLLSQAVRANAMDCFVMLINQGANVNLACDGYIPPLMHAAKYGRLAMAKLLVAKGADVHYKYSGSYKTADGETPATYAAKYNQVEVAEYLRSIEQKQ